MSAPQNTGTPPPTPYALEHRAWQQVASATTVLLPLGSTEQHGSHLPLNTDTVIATTVAEALCQMLREENEEAVVAPAVPYGSSGEHQQFPGTVSIGGQALETLIVEFGRSAKVWADRLIIVNGHGGNVEPLHGALKTLRQEGRETLWVTCESPGADPRDTHAGHRETSLMLFLRPGRVRMDLAAAGTTEPLNRIMPQLIRSGVRAVSANGVLGDPTAASAEAGQRLFAEMLETAHRHLRDELRTSDDG